MDLDTIFTSLIKLRHEISKKIEDIREKEGIGSSEDAQVVLYLDEAWMKEMAPLQALDELKNVLKVSLCQLRSIDQKLPEIKMSDIDGVAIDVRYLDWLKCARCRIKSDTIGCATEWGDPNICMRCFRTLSDENYEEFRYFA